MLCRDEAQIVQPVAKFEWCGCQLLVSCPYLADSDLIHAGLPCSKCLGEPAAENTALSTSVASVEICFHGRAHNKIKTFNK